MRTMSALQFYEETLNAVEELTKSESFSRPEGEHNRRLITERLPLAVFFQHLRRPGLNVDCQYDTDGQVDALVHLGGSVVESGHWKPDYSVEATSAIWPNEHLVRESLLNQGWATGYERKAKGLVVSEYRAVSDEEEFEDRLKVTLQVIDKKQTKAQKSPSSEARILVIGLFLDRELFINEMTDLSKKLPKPASFDRAFIVEPFRNLVVELTRSSIDEINGEILASGNQE